MKIKSLPMNRIFQFKLLFLIVIACSGCGNKANKKIELSDELEVKGIVVEDASGVNYRIPTPIDIFVLLQSQKAPFVGQALNNPENSVHYNTSLSKAVNFGIYATDLAYCSVFGDFQTSLIYYNAAKELAVPLGLYEGYGEQIANRINSNLNNVDSLIDISSESYYQITTFLEDQGMSDVLALIRFGCWIESLYLAIESVDQFDQSSPIIERIVDQQLLLDNLVGILKQNTYSENVNQVLEMLVDLQEIYDTLYSNSEEVRITKKQYVNIVNKVRELRINFVG